MRARGNRPTRRADNIKEMDMENVVFQFPKPKVTKADDVVYVRFFDGDVYEATEQGRDWCISERGDQYAHVRGPQEGIHTQSDVVGYITKMHTRGCEMRYEDATSTVSRMRKYMVGD